MIYRGKRQLFRRSISVADFVYCRLLGSTPPRSRGHHPAPHQIRKGLKLPLQHHHGYGQIQLEQNRWSSIPLPKVLGCLCCRTSSAHQDRNVSPEHHQAGDRIPLRPLLTFVKADLCTYVGLSDRRAYTHLKIETLKNSLHQYHVYLKAHRS